VNRADDLADNLAGNTVNVPAREPGAPTANVDAESLELLPVTLIKLGRMVERRTNAALRGRDITAAQYLALAYLAEEILDLFRPPHRPVLAGMTRHVLDRLGEPAR
jgi:hypothetical protein